MTSFRWGSAIAAALLFAGTLVACSGDNGTPTGPSASPASGPQVVVSSVTRVDVTGGDGIEGRGRPLQLRATVRFSDGSSLDQTSTATWISSPAPLPRGRLLLEAGCD